MGISVVHPGTPPITSGPTGLRVLIENEAQVMNATTNYPLGPFDVENDDILMMMLKHDGATAGDLQYTVRGDVAATPMPPAVSMPLLASYLGTNTKGLVNAAPISAISGEVVQIQITGLRWLQVVLRNNGAGQITAIYRLVVQPWGR